MSQLAQLSDYDLYSLVTRATLSEDSLIEALEELTRRHEGACGGRRQKVGALAMYVGELAKQKGLL